MAQVWALVGVTLLLAPVALFVAVRLEPGRPLALAALDVPLAVAIDVLSVLLVARVLTLEWATVVSRVVWATAGSFALWQRRGRAVAGLRAVPVAAWATALFAAAAAVLVSRTMSVPHAVWDRQWHIPLATSLRGERVPFFNVYENRGRLFYHYSGDALAAMVQTLSFAHVHISNALSRVHDAMFGLVGLFLGLLLPAFGRRSLVGIAAVLLASLLGGPANLLREGDARAQAGYSITNLLTLSFRPHVSLSYLLILGFAAALLLPMAEKDVTPAAARPALCAVTGLLMLTDETSLGLLGLMAGAVWLLEPRALGGSRARGAAVLVALAAIMAVVVLVYGGTLGRGAPRQTATLVDWQLPGFYQAAVPLAEERGRRLLLIDLMAVFGTLAVGALLAVASRSKLAGRVFAAYAAVAVPALLCFTRLNLNGDSLEVHRFATAPMLLAPFFAFLLLARAARDAATPAFARSAAGAIAFVSLAAPAFSTIEWLAGPADSALEASKGFWGTDHFYTTDCRAAVGAKIGDPTRPTYVTQDLWYLYAGCRPLVAPGPEAGHGQDRHELLIGMPDVGPNALRRLHAWLGPGDSLAAYCNAGGVGGDDSVCAAARGEKTCRPRTKLVDECTLTGPMRRALLGGG
jgi:hypothetical protein